MTMGTCDCQGQPTALDDAIVTINLMRHLFFGQAGQVLHKSRRGGHRAKRFIPTQGLLDGNGNDENSDGAYYWPLFVQ